MVAFTSEADRIREERKSEIFFQMLRVSPQGDYIIINEECTGQKVEALHLSLQEKQKFSSLKARLVIGGQEFRKTMDSPYSENGKTYREVIYALVPDNFDMRPTKSHSIYSFLAQKDF
ncbi:MAG: hypothetical protein ABIE22_01470 [archaeon]